MCSFSIFDERKKSEMTFSTERLCRTCMIESDTLISIWPAKKRAPLDPASSISVMLKSFTTIDAIEGDGLPDHLCITCISELNRAYSFKQKCERSEYTLRTFLQPAANVKMEETATVIEENIDEHIDNEIEILSDETIETSESDAIAEPPKTNYLVLLPSSELEASPTTIVETETNLVYQCSTCSINFLTYVLLKEHLFKEHNALHCDQCNIYYNTDAFAAHLKTHEIVGKSSSNSNDDSRKFACEICSLDFTKKDVFDEHCLKFHMVEEPFEMIINDNDDHVLTEITYDEDYTETDADANTIDLATTECETTVPTESNDNANDKKFYCNYCNASFVKQYSLRFHHNSRKCREKTFECNICHRMFAQKRNLLAHLEEHKKSEEIVCLKCESIFGADELEKYTEHMKTVHQETKKFQCNICSKYFGMSSTLKDHMRVHSGERPFLCSICGKGFSQNANLKQHVMRHNKTKPFKCKTCSQTFVSKGELDAHDRKHTGQHPFVCDSCGSSFTTSSSLVKHRRIHTGERPYGCEHCPMRFSVLATLKNHRRTHTGERPFKCEHCDRKFTQKSDCVIHMRTHTGERPYTCPHCPQSFTHSSSWRQHSKNHSKSAKANMGIPTAIPEMAVAVTTIENECVINVT